MRETEIHTNGIPNNVLPVIARFPEMLALAGRTPVDGSSAALFRILFGLVCLAGIVRFFAHGWVSELHVEPAHHFTYLGFGWVTPWPGWGMHLHFALLGVLALGIAIGYRYRVGDALAFFLGFTYVELLDKTNYLNHYYMVSLISFLMVFLPLHRSLSVDRWLAERGGSSPTGCAWGSVPAATLWVLRAQVALVYLFADIAKLNPDWLLEAQPLRIWLHHHTDLPLVGPPMSDLWVAYAMSWTGAFFDLTIVGWLLWRRTRVYAFHRRRDAVDGIGHAAIHLQDSCRTLWLMPKAPWSPFDPRYISDMPMT